jgi:hypothetical protein
MAAIFWFVTNDVPLLKKRRKAGAKPVSCERECRHETIFKDMESHDATR